MRPILQKLSGFTASSTRSRSLKHRQPRKLAPKRSEARDLGCSQVSSAEHVVGCYYIRLSSLFALALRRVPLSREYDRYRTTHTVCQTTRRGCFCRIGSPPPRSCAFGGPPIGSGRFASGRRRGASCVLRSCAQGLVTRAFAGSEWLVAPECALR